MNNLWKIHSVGGFYQNIVPIFDDVRYSLNEAFIISKPKCLGMCAPGCFFYQSVCQVSDSADKVYILSVSYTHLDVYKRQSRDKSSGKTGYGECSRCMA